MTSPAHGILNLVLAVIVHGDDLCLLRREKPPYRHHWGLPGGKIHFGESVPDAAQREAFEETGLPVGFRHIGHVATEVIRSGAGVPEAHFVMFAVVLDAAHRDFRASAEGELRWMPIAEFVDHMPDGPIIPSDRIMAHAALRQTMVPRPSEFHVRHCDDRFILLPGARP